MKEKIRIIIPKPKDMPDVIKSIDIKRVNKLADGMVEIFFSRPLKGDLYKILGLFASINKQKEGDMVLMDNKENIVGVVCYPDIWINMLKEKAPGKINQFIKALK